jgi:Spy/CpxP family protein refolding chaperone
MLFGVRRPLRFMAQRLELDDAQIQVLAAILNQLKTERAQAAVDDQRTVALFADALEAPEFDAGRADQGLDLRIQSAQRLKEAVRGALERTHAMLRPEQRARLAYMLRSGALSI